MLFITVSCTENYDLDDRELSIEYLSGYVAFNPPGTSVKLDDVTTKEGGDDVTFNIEVPTGNLSDVFVKYSFSGDAIFGTDFKIDGASSAGGEITIKHKQTTDPKDSVADNIDLVIEILKDGTKDGNKNLTITLDSASNSEGDLAIGRGGTSLLRNAKIVIQDID